jgi:predicted transcriptional regulator
MSTPVFTAKSDQALEEVAHHFEAISMLPVVDEDMRCIGVISKKDQAKASHGVRSILSSSFFFFQFLQRL